ncbi:hypothetical protein MAPG_00836 [Magnaporthiopsis poae ATCC 64411]|uniref:SGNH hydrolase-type esterase domain-containing protein n=1 Tax=Magnaporthiopsis poae (strain ATCC 64411 / 73-15) TaxID=644358 RepID=A0A0C4DM36_MAGP6|nr:hypothetical protein MAPG_00836 [Magnaporthiopsis poae ATCC 64411]
MHAKAILIGLLSATGAIAATYPDATPLQARDSKQVLGKDRTLRIMALGASITYGQGSDKTGGYRQELVRRLKEGKNKVEMVGEREHGDFTENKVEGWPGKRIDEILKDQMASVEKNKPAIVLLNVGTNDAVQNKDIDKAGDRYEDLVKEILKRGGPRTVVLASTLVHNRNKDAEERVKKINTQIERAVNKLIKEKKRVVLVNMFDKGPNPDKKDGESEYHDDIHPNERGYKKMAEVWEDAIKEADRRKLLAGPGGKVKKAADKTKQKLKKMADKPKKKLSKQKSKMLDEIRKIIQDEFKKVEDAIKDLKKDIKKN